MNSKRGGVEQSGQNQQGGGLRPKHLDENATGSRPRRNSSGYCHSPDPGSILIPQF